MNLALVPHKRMIFGAAWDGASDRTATGYPAWRAGPGLRRIGQYAKVGRHLMSSPKAAPAVRLDGWAKVGGERPSGPPTRQKRESADKPGSVVGNHPSGTHVAVRLERPTRKPLRAAGTSPKARALPYLVLLQVGFAVPPNVATGAVRSYRTLSPLPATGQFLDHRAGFSSGQCGNDPRHRRFALCCTFRGLAPPRRYLAPCPVEPGLSSAS